MSPPMSIGIFKAAMKVSTGALYYDPDGTGAAARVQVALLSENLPLTHSDIWII